MAELSGRLEALINNQESTFVNGTTLEVDCHWTVGSLSEGLPGFAE